jgi:hypothetical protein
VIVAVVVGLFGLFLFTAWKNSTTVEAQLVNYYPSVCEGGWVQPMRAVGQPDVVEGNAYTPDNSAMFIDNAASIYCSQYSGMLPPQTYHTRVMVRFSWQQPEPVTPARPERSAPPNGVVIPLVATSTGTSSDSIDTANSSSTTTTTLTDTDGTDVGDYIDDTEATTSVAADVATSAVIGSDGDVGEEPSATDVPASQSEIPEQSPTETIELENAVDTPPAPTENSPESTGNESAWWQQLLPLAHANEQLNEISDISTSTDITVAVPAMSSDAVPPEAQFMVQYTLDGVTWHVLGYVATVSNDVRFLLPKAVVSTIEDISLLQIAIVPLMQYDVVPVVYLDAIWLEVEYAPNAEIGAYAETDLVPIVDTIDAVILPDIVATSNAATGTLSRTDFVQGLRYVHGLDERYVLTAVAINATTTELWVFDMALLTRHRIGYGNAAPGKMLPATKDKMVFWKNIAEDKLYVYDLRTAGDIHEIVLVQNASFASEQRLSFPFTHWELVWRGDKSYFYSRDSGEVFQDEHTAAAMKLFLHFGVTQTLSYDTLHTIGATFIAPEDVLPVAVTAAEATSSLLIVAPATTTEDTGMVSADTATASKEYNE